MPLPLFFFFFVDNEHNNNEYCFPFEKHNENIVIMSSCEFTPKTKKAEKPLLTLFETHLEGVWVDEDCVENVGIGKKQRQQRKKYGNQLLKRQQIPQDYTLIPGLRGQYGCFAQQSLKKGLDLGIYEGHIFTKTNYEQYGQENKEDFSISTHDSQQRPYVIEPFDDNMIFQWINDGKRNSPKNLCNVEFRECQLFGVPLIQVITTKKIKKNEQLFVDYGDKYWKSREQSMLEQKKKK